MNDPINPQGNGGNGNYRLQRIESDVKDKVDKKHYDIETKQLADRMERLERKVNDLSRTYNNLLRAILIALLTGLTGLVSSILTRGFLG